jgi:single-strand DNA-binding protein
MVTLIGICGKDADFRQNENNKSASFNLATSESYQTKDGEKVEKTTWHRIVGFGYKADYCQKWIKKGCRVAITGKIRNREYEENGIKKFISEILIDEVLLLSQPQGSNNNQPAPAEPTTTTTTKSEEEDLPF